MADLVITAANVVPGAGKQTANGTAGASITAGQPVYLDNTTGTIKPASANTSAATAAVVGIAVNGASANQPVVYQTAGVLALGAVLTTGKVYVASANSGNIAPVADLASGWNTTILGYATSASNLQVNLVVSGVAN